MSRSLRPTRRRPRRAASIVESLLALALVGVTGCSALASLAPEGEPPPSDEPAAAPADASSPAVAPPPTHAVAEGAVPDTAAPALAEAHEACYERVAGVLDRAGKRSEVDRAGDEGFYRWRIRYPACTDPAERARVWSMTFTWRPAEVPPEARRLCDGVRPGWGESVRHELSAAQKARLEGCLRDSLVARLRETEGAGASPTSAVYAPFVERTRDVWRVGVEEGAVFAYLDGYILSAGRGADVGSEFTPYCPHYNGLPDANEPRFGAVSPDGLGAVIGQSDDLALSLVVSQSVERAPVDDVGVTRCKSRYEAGARDCFREHRGQEREDCLAVARKTMSYCLDRLFADVKCGEVVVRLTAADSTCASAEAVPDAAPAEWFIDGVCAARGEGK